MGAYANQSMPIHPQKRQAERLLEERGDQRKQAQLAAAKFLASINLSAEPSRESRQAGDEKNARGTPSSFKIIPDEQMRPDAADLSVNSAHCGY